MDDKRLDERKPSRTFDSAYSFSFAIAIGLILFIAGLVVSLTLGGGTMVGKLLSISPRSGNFSTELILMTGLSIPLRIGSATGCGTNQLRPNSNRTRALPANPKYLSKGI